MDRMSTLDAEFLHLEDETSHMHIAGVCTFRGEPPSLDELRDLIAAKLHLIPRYRQRVQPVPLELGRPVWVDDPHFHLDFHLRHTALPAPGGDAELHQLMGRLMSQSLDRNRPLWETWLVEGLDDDRWALVFKIHHCMVDGIAGVGLLTVLLDLEPDAERPVAPVLEPGAASPRHRSWCSTPGRGWCTTRCSWWGRSPTWSPTPGPRHSGRASWPPAWDACCGASRTRRTRRSRGASAPTASGPTARCRSTTSGTSARRWAAR